MRRGDAILRVDGTDLTDATVEECFKANTYIGSSSSLLLQREGKQVEVILVRTSTEQLLNNQVLFGHLDALDKAIGAVEVASDAANMRAAFQQLLAYIIDLERKRSQSEMETAARLGHLQSAIIQKINLVESMLRPVSELGEGLVELASSVRPSSSSSASRLGHSLGSSCSFSQRAPRFKTLPASDITQDDMSPRSADIIIKLGLNYIDDPPDSDRRRTFTRTLKGDLSIATALPSDTFSVTSLLPGSVLAHVTISSNLADARAVAADLKQQASAEP